MITRIRIEEKVKETYSDFLHPNLVLTNKSSSTVSLLVGERIFLLLNDFPYQVDDEIIVQDRTNLANSMMGKVTSYISATKTLTLNIPDGCISGSGISSDWNISGGDKKDICFHSKELNIIAGFNVGDEIDVVNTIQAVKDSFVQFTTDFTPISILEETAQSFVNLGYASIVT